MSKRRNRQKLFRIVVEAFDALERVTGVKFPRQGIDKFVKKFSDSEALSEEDQKNRKSEN